LGGVEDGNDLEGMQKPRDRLGVALDAIDKVLKLQL
jgi:hypothetical protein